MYIDLRRRYSKFHTFLADFVIGIACFLVVNPLLGLLAIPGFILGGLFLGLAFLLPVTVIGFPLIMGIWAVFCLIRG